MNRNAQRPWALLAAIASCVFFGASAAALADENGGDGGEHSGGKGHVVQFQATGTSGTESTDPNSKPGCQFGGQCIVDSKGTATVTAGSYTFPATYSSTLTIDYSKVTFPTPTSFCAPASGTVTLTSTVHASDQIFKSEQGQVCGGTAPGAPHTFSGTYIITGGSGRFARASGSGTVTVTDNGTGTISSSDEKGTIRYKGARGGDNGDNGDDGDNGHNGG